MFTRQFHLKIALEEETALKLRILVVYHANITPCELMTAFC